MITKTTFATMLNNPVSLDKLRRAIASAKTKVSHVTNKQGKIFLAMYVKGDKLCIVDCKGNEVTKQFKLALRG